MSRAPVLLLFHPGGFVVGDPSMERQAAEYGRSRGFQTKNIDYPLGDLSAAMKAARDAATTASEMHDVVAYGESAGGCLTAWLAERALVQAAVSYSCLPDVQAFMNSNIGGLGQMLGATQHDLYRVSPINRKSKKRILAISATDDVVALPENTAEWADDDDKVTLHEVTGGHVGAGPYGGQTQGAPYVTNMRYGIDWLKDRL